MGEQIHFYMTSSDESSFISSLTAEADIVVVHNYFSAKKPTIASLHQTMTANDPDLSIMNRDFNPKVFVSHHSDGMSSLELTDSELIQFNRCALNVRGELEPGRLWYDHETVNCKPKRKVFLLWAQSVFRYIKKEYHLSTEHYGRYFGPDAWEQFRNGDITLAAY